MSIAAATMARVEVNATTVLRRVQAAHRQRVQASSSCPGGCSAPVDAASPKNFGAGIGSVQRPQAREEARVPAMGVCQSSTGHNLRTENGAHGGWQGNIARMHVAGLGNSSARHLPVPKTANDAAYGRQVDVVMVDTPLRPSLLQLRMSGPPRVSRSCGVTWRSRARHVGRAQTAAPERIRAFGAGGPVNEGRTARPGAALERILHG